MPLDLIQASTVALDANFRRRVAVGMYQVAREHLLITGNEPQQIMNKALARMVMQSDADQFIKYAAMVVTDPDVMSVGSATAIPATISDTLIVNTIREMWPTIAGS